MFPQKYDIICINSAITRFFMTKFISYLMVPLLLIGTLAACGQKGNLYMPIEPATEEAAQEPTTQEKAEEIKKAEKAPREQGVPEEQRQIYRNKVQTKE